MTVNTERRDRRDLDHEIARIEFFPIVLIPIGVTIVLPTHLGGEHAHQPATS